MDMNRSSYCTPDMKELTDFESNNKETQKSFFVIILHVNSTSKQSETDLWI